MQNNLTQNLLSQGISRLSASLFLAVTLAVLAGCGSGGSGGTPVSSGTAGTGTGTGTGTTGTPTVPAPTGTPAASIQLLASATQMPSSGAVTVDLTAVVLSNIKQAVTGRTVTFSTITDTTAFTDPPSASGVSDANGIVTTKLHLGTDKSNRTITVTAMADSATATNSVDVTGTTITISGNSSLASSAATKLTISVKDSAGNALQAMPVNVVSQNGDSIVLAPLAGTTNSSGQMTATVTASSATAIAAGKDVITANAAGASTTQALTISSASFSFTAPAANVEIPLTGAGSAPTVTVNWTDLVTSPVGKTVTFSSSRGTVAGGTVTSSSSTLLAAGTASVTVSSTTAGPAIITASGPNNTPAATLNVVFVATSASNATVQAVPGTVEVTTGSASQTNNSSTITVLVRDINNNLVKNAGVSFTITSDPSGGSLTSSTGITDVSGSASVTYVAGGTSSAQNGVTISATVSTIGGVAIAPVIGTTTLTVAGQSLQVRLESDNLIAVDPTTNANLKNYLAIVTDAAGNPMVGTKVNFTLRPGRYNKGIFLPDTKGSFWVAVPTVTCPNEDLNFNGILDPGEGLVVFPAGVTPALRPGTVASVNASATTDAHGFAIATIAYAKGFSFWAEVTLEARTSVTTNDPPTQTSFLLSGLAADYTPLANAPPPIPFGSDNNCADTL